MDIEENAEKFKNAPLVLFEGKRRGYDMTRTLIAILMTCGYLSFHFYLMTHVVDPTMKEMVSTSLNTIDTAFIFIIGFYFGSSFSKLNARNNDTKKE